MTVLVDAKQTSTLGPIELVKAFRRDPLALFESIAVRPDGMTRTTVAGRDLVCITDPDHVHQVLQTNHPNYDKKAPIYSVSRPFLGNGLPVIQGGEEWSRRRKLINPAFHRSNVHLVSDITERYLVDGLADWHRIAASGEPVDLSLWVTELTMRIVLKALYGTEITEGGAEIAHNFENISLFVASFLKKPYPPLFVPTRRNRSFHTSMRHINQFVSQLVRTRQADPKRHDDLLQLLLGALDATSGECLTRKQLQDELIGLFFAGHDTLSHALAWCWYLLARHPRVDERLQEELDTVLGGRPARLADIPKLTYTRMVLDEAMRLYPPLWLNMRRAIEEDDIGGHRIRAGSLVAWCTYSVNRHPRVWEEPYEFRPERFVPEQAANRPRYALVPFGEGPRKCIGSTFAEAEAMLILSTLTQHHRVELVSDEPVQPVAAITLHPGGGVVARLRPRSGHA